jgi:hypothetical protein
MPFRGEKKKPGEVPDHASSISARADFSGALQALSPW